MTDSLKKLMRTQIQENLNSFLDLVKKPVPKGGWVRTIREALGLSNRMLSKKMRCSQSNITKIESGEKRGTISLRNLQRAAEAMNCKLVYCIVPLKPLEHMLEDQARIMAKKQIRLINHSMKLEQQGLNEKQLKQQEDALVQELLQGNPRYLWDTEDV